jgi:hypothetical protein
MCDGTDEDKPRWPATIWYRSDGGLVDVTHDFEELVDLHWFVEQGPNFYTIERIEIRITPPVREPNDQRGGPT